MYNGRTIAAASLLQLPFKRSLLSCVVVVAAAASSGSAFANTSSLISQQDSVVAESIKADAEKCAAGTQEGTIGHSIGDALKIHTELASATPNVESLFSAASDCFSGLGSLFDLSGSIPSLSSILSAAQAAVMQYAKKKVCTAVQQVTSMVTSPINDAIGKVSSGTSLGNLNGLTNGLISQGMSGIDPQLGAGYHAPPAGAEFNYTIDVNPFNQSQTDFGGGAATPPPAASTATARPAAKAVEVAPVEQPVTPSQSESSGSSQSWSDRASNLFN